jgi:hypothetical protein
MRYSALFSSVLGVVLLGSVFPSRAADLERWSSAQAQSWYAAQPWVLGSNYVPSDAINELEMWQAATFDPKRIDVELGWAQGLGMNTMRVFLHDLLWEQDPRGFKQRIRVFLQIAAQHHIKPIFVLFDSCWDPDPRLGPQHPPIPGVHNSGWVQAPGAKALDEPAQYGRLRAYVKDILGTFGKDDRVLAWDVWNEPDNPGGGNYDDREPRDKLERVAVLLPQVFAWARSVHPTQPLTSGLWHGGDWSRPADLNAVEKTQIADSDIITFHAYGWPEAFFERVRELEAYGRPLVCTEYMARGAGSTFDGVLPVGKRMNVGMINWGFVNGRTQTNLPWDSWQRPYVLTQPTVWFHDILHADGTPYREREVELLRAISAAPKSVVPDTLGLGGPVAVYTPDLAAHPHEDASYPRIIRLEHAGTANGTLLATFFHGGAGKATEFLIYRSRDNGWSWSGPIGAVRDTVHGEDLDAPTLFELPRAESDLPAGALLAAGTAWKHGDFTHQDMEVYASLDGGSDWTYRSSCTREKGMPDKHGVGIWEPSFAIAANGELVCYFSDERPSVRGFNQVLAHVASTDGGKTWGPEVFDVAIHDSQQRPGMTTVVRLPTGRYAMSFEDCRAGFDPDEACAVYVKTSPDGLDWQPAANKGVLVATAQGQHLLHTPMIAWSSWGGRDGTLIVSGQRVVNGHDGALTALPESGRTLMVNTRLGEGPWREIASPLVVDPTGGYDSGETPCPGYSAGILPDLSGPGFQIIEALHITNGRCRVAIGHGWLPAGP